MVPRTFTSRPRNSIQWTQSVSGPISLSYPAISPLPILGFAFPPRQEITPWIIVPSALCIPTNTGPTKMASLEEKMKAMLADFSTWSREQRRGIEYMKRHRGPGPDDIAAAELLVPQICRFRQNQLVLEEEALASGGVAKRAGRPEEGPVQDENNNLGTPSSKRQKTRDQRAEQSDAGQTENDRFTLLIDQQPKDVLEYFKSEEFEEHMVGSGFRRPYIPC